MEHSDQHHVSFIFQMANMASSGQLSCRPRVQRKEWSHQTDPGVLFSGVCFHPFCRQKTDKHLTPTVFDMFFRVWLLGACAAQHGAKRRSEPRKR